MSRDVSNSEDILDSRDIEARIAELEASAEGDTDYNDDDEAELTALIALREEAGGYASDWKYGATLVRDSYFEDYAQQLAEDIGAIDPNANWPMSCIDWKQAARELQMDYTAVDFDGVTYWIR
jgi:hypothetical protein